MWWAVAELTRPATDARALALLRDCGGRAARLEEPEYPEGLRGLRSPPPIVYLAGAWAPVSPAVAIVGARNASPDGRDVARRLAADLAGSGVAVLSGLACGIDTAAHEGALDAGGRSGAVLGTGLERAYPRENAALSERLRTSVGLLSEIPPGSTPRPSTFASRNRLLAALAGATIVVQGRAHSGALVTAREARYLGRPVGAIPWDCRDPLGEAPHALIRAREATLVRHAGDVLELLGMGRRALGSRGATAGFQLALEESQVPRDELPEAEARLLAALRHRPLPLDVVAFAAGLSAAVAGAALVSLELKGLARSEAGGLVLRIRGA